VPEDSTNVLRTELGTIKRKAMRRSREPGTRLQVVGIWMFVALLAAMTGSEVREASTPLRMTIPF
jgi:hypothetical protein